MMTALSDWLAGPYGLTPHGFCLLWEPALIWLDVLADGIIGLAYFSIPVALWILVRRRRDLVFRSVFLLFALFIVLCGSTHWLDVLTVWVPAYRLDALAKVATAVASVLTAVAVWLLLPKALLLPSAIQMREVRQALAERERQAVELSRLNEDLEQFAYIASHDLKAPLHAISRLVTWIQEDIEGDVRPETLKHLQLMSQRVRRMEMLIGSLLKYSRAGHTSADAVTVNIAGLVDEIAVSIGPLPGFVVRFRGALASIVTARVPLEHVLRNLISNAIVHHDRPDGEVIVSARSHDGMTEFRVADDGPGIVPEYHQRIFKIFHTLKSRDEHDTSGVGLSIVKKIVERAGGTVWVESAPPRRGSTFVFTWPGTLLAA